MEPTKSMHILLVSADQLLRDVYNVDVGQTAMSELYIGLYETNVRLKEIFTNLQTVFQLVSVISAEDFKDAFLSFIVEIEEGIQVMMSKVFQYKSKWSYICNEYPAVKQMGLFLMVQRLFWTLESDELIYSMQREKWDETLRWSENGRVLTLDEYHYYMQILYKCKDILCHQIPSKIHEYNIWLGRVYSITNKFLKIVREAGDKILLAQPLLLSTQSEFMKIYFRYKQVLDGISLFQDYYKHHKSNDGPPLKFVIQDHFEQIALYTDLFNQKLQKYCLHSEKNKNCVTI